MSNIEAENAFRKLSSILNMPKSKTSIDILKTWYTPEDIKILMAGPFRMIERDRYSIEDYAKEAELPIETVRETFERLAKRGVLFYYISKYDGKKKYMLPPLFPGLVEYFIINPNVNIDERRKFVKQFHVDTEFTAFLFNPSDVSAFRILPALKPGTESRLIQVGEEVQIDKSQVFTYQDVEKIVKEAGQYENNIAVLPCTCRIMSMMQKTNPDCKKTIETCFFFGMPARYTVEQGMGRYVDVDETLEILKQSEKEGLVHLSQNTVDKHGFICNCCDCCCGILTTAKKYNLPNIFQKTDYVPVFNMETCKHCKTCVRKCPLYAISYVTGEKEDKSDDKIKIREDGCIGCGVCASNCPSGSISLKKVREVKPADSFIEAVTMNMAGFQDK